jgi:hypothetical protein
MPRLLARHPRTRAAVLWTLFIATVAVLLAMTGATVGEQVDPASVGTPGTAVIVHCYRQGTDGKCYGTFRTNDGAVHLADTRIFGADDLVFNLTVVAWLLALALVQFWFRIMIPRRRRRALTPRSMIIELDEQHH